MAARRPHETTPTADRAVPRHAGGRARRQRQYAGRLPSRPRRTCRGPRGQRHAPSRRAGTDDLRGHLGRLAERGLAAASVARRLSAIRQLYRFLYAEGHRGDDPAAVIEGPKRGRSLPKVLSVKQVDDLLAQARNGLQAERMPERLRAARLACLLEVALRHRPAGLRTGRAAGDRGPARPAHAGGARQGRARATRAAQRRVRGKP